MGEFWGFVDWGAGCLALIVAVVFSFLLGVRTGRIRERNESVRSRIRQNKANMYRYKQQLASQSTNPQNSPIPVTVWIYFSNNHR